MWCQNTTRKQKFPDFEPQGFCGLGKRTVTAPPPANRRSSGAAALAEMSESVDAAPRVPDIDARIGIKPGAADPPGSSGRFTDQEETHPWILE